MLAFPLTSTDRFCYASSPPTSLPPHLISYSIAFTSLASFQDVEAAEESLTAEHFLDGRRLRVERAKVNRTLFLAKLNVLLTPPELRRIAELYGEVESVTIIKHHPTNKSKGCGFVKYRYREDASDAFTGLKNTHKKWVVEWATSSNDPELLGVAPNLVYIGGLPTDLTTEAVLKSHFSRYGSIFDISVVHPSPTSTIRNSSPALDALEEATSSSTAKTTTPTTVPSLPTSPTHSSLSSTAFHPVPVENLPPSTNGQYSASIPPPDSLTSHSSPLDNPSSFEPEILEARRAISDTHTESKPSSQIPLLSLAMAQNSTALLTSYAFITFSEPSAAAAAIENENGASFLGAIIRVQYCETPDMKLRKKIAKLHTVFSHPSATPYADPTQQFSPHLYASYPAYFPGGSPVISHPPSPHLSGSSAPVVVPTTNGSVAYYSGSPTQLSPTSVSSSSALSASDAPGWYFHMPPLQISVPNSSRDLVPSQEHAEVLPSPISIPIGFHPFSPSPTFAPLGFASTGQMSPLTSPIAIPPNFAAYQLHLPQNQSQSPASPITLPHRSSPNIQVQQKK